MTPEQIRRRHRVIEKQQWKWAHAEDELQKICLHPDHSKKYDSNTGNYDPTADSHWIDYHCPDCGKRWRTEQ